MSLDDLLVFCLFLYVVYSILRFVLGLVWSILCWIWRILRYIWRRIDPRYLARARREMERIAKRTKRNQRDIGKVYVSLMEVADQVADKLARRR
jgi:hypothetical protein